MAAAVANPPKHVCCLCRRKFPGAEALSRHELLSELHQQNLERQDALVQQHKDQILGSIMATRHQIHETSDSEAGRRGQLETQLRHLLGEYGQAQEMLEHSRTAREGSAAWREERAMPPRSGEARLGKLLLHAGAATWQGGKESQEDRHFLDLELVSPEGRTIPGYCVLDGHAGSRCVEHVLERLSANLQACLSAKPSLTEENLKLSVVEAFALTDEEFLVGARQQNLIDGSTMILGLFFEETQASAQSPRIRLLIANLGDSRAVLCRAWEQQLNALRLSDDHKPNRQDEKQRIEARGGVVALHGVWRVFAPAPMTFNGRVIPRSGLAVSRAFGDILLKEPERFGCNIVAPGGLVSAVPELSVFEVDPSSDRFLVLACDGIWDVLRDDDAVAVCASQAGPELAAHALVRHAFAAGSGDNLTAVVVSWQQAD